MDEMDEMDEITERYTRIAGSFTDRVREVAADAWDDASPCEGWTARDVVGHLTEWIPGFFGDQGVAFGDVPSVDVDPVGAWLAVDAALSAALADRAQSARTIENPFGPRSLTETIDMIVVGDVFVHTWDLARATGLDESLDADQIQRMLDSMGSMPDELLRADGMFAPRIDVSDDADDQTKLLAFLGRRAERS
jgi:uncharacterized protein (TIGR03086 family)